jgi:hypothetical protein
VPFRARAFCTQAQRQAGVNKLFGPYLLLLLQELGVPAGQQEQVRTALWLCVCVYVCVCVRVCVCVCGCSVL